MKAQHDLVNRVKQIKADLYSLNLSTTRWRQFVSPRPLPWKKIAFSSVNKTLIPRVRGLYAFSVEVADHNLPAHGYILYVGHTGDDSNANLNARYGQYLTETQRRRARAKIIYMMTEWANDLVFNFVEVPDKRISLKKLESSLITAVLPPVNSVDFEAEIQKAKRAFIP